MKKRTGDPTDAGHLRKRAEESLAKGKASAGTTRLEHELDVHRIELEMQNEQLRATQTELEAGLDRYTQLFDFAPIAYVTLAADGTITQVNHAAATLLGRPRKRVVGQPFVWFVTADHRTAFQAMLADVVTHHLDKSCEVELRVDLPERPVVRMTAASLAGKEPLILVAFQDISLHKRAESALRRADEELREADRRKDEFLAVLSHELRTPLSTLLLHGQLLERGTLDANGIKRSGRTIVRAARAQSRLIEDLLDVSRIVQGKLTLKRNRVSVDTVVRAAADSVAGPAKERLIDVVLDIEPSVTQVQGDPDRLQQAVANLLTNAIKFTPPEGRVEVSLREVDRQVQIQVRDTGMGIDPAFLPHIFLRFAQGDRTTTRAAGGLGLGLSIAQTIVEAHHGHIRAESPGRGKGSTFTITLPPMPAVVSEGAELTPLPWVETNIRGARLLIVEDDSSTRETLTQIFELAGGDVREADGPATAMQVLDEFKPDLLVCDIAMPGEDGISLLRRIRARGAEHGGDVRAIALTAFAGEDMRKRTLAAGFQEHLVKPINVDQLLDTVSHLLH
jgi:PAS domain S-box-containing protein